jgi:translation initiation factor 3 subunit F
MMQDNDICLRENNTLIYKLHPVVVFSILDHYKRRKRDQVRVIGTLLGTKDGKEIQITNCFPVPHNDKGNDMVELDMDYHAGMMQLHKRVNMNEVVVGWYSTGNELSYTSAIIHEEYQTLCQFPCVHVTADVALTNSEMAIKAYTATHISLGGRKILSRFDPANMEVDTYDPEKIGVDALINGEPENKTFDSPATVLTEEENLELSLNNFLSLLSEVNDYVGSVLKGERKGNVQLGKEILSALGSIPSMDRDLFNTMFNNNIQDLLMTVYFAELTRSQLAIADKINALL